MGKAAQGGSGMQVPIEYIEAIGVMVSKSSWTEEEDEG